MDVNIALLIKSSVIPSERARFLTTDKAACTDSCMTSPSLPVVIVLPSPGSTTDSVVSSSPPNLGPGQTGHLTDLVFTFGHAEAVTPHAEELVEVARTDASLL